MACESAEYAVSVSDYDDAAMSSPTTSRIGRCPSAVISPMDERGFSDLLLLATPRCDLERNAGAPLSSNSTSDVHSVVAAVVVMVPIALLLSWWS